MADTGNMQVQLQVTHSGSHSNKCKSDNGQKNPIGAWAEKNKLEHWQKQIGTRFGIASSYKSVGTIAG